MKIKPIDTKGINLMDSVWGNIETEQVVTNLLIISRRIDPDKWTPFSWESYKKNCTHTVTESEKGVLDALVKGGKPVWNTTAYLQPGYLEMQENQYVVTDKLLEVIQSKMVNP